MVMIIVITLNQQPPSWAPSSRPEPHTTRQGRRSTQEIRQMSTITIDNKPGSSGHRKMNVLVAPDRAAIIPFVGETIPGVARITKSQYVKQGKWSHDVWDIELADGWAVFVWWTSNANLQFVAAETWGQAIADVQSAIRNSRARVEVTAEAVENFIRTCLHKTAIRLDTEAAKAALPAVGVAAELIEAQRLAAEAQREESAVKALVAAEIARREAQEAQVAEAAKVRREAEAAKARAAKAREALRQAGSMSLADLKALLK
jgi:valyl-tRNA synthetase